MGSAPSRRYPCASKQKRNTAAHVQLNGILPPITAPPPHIPPLSCAIGASEPKRDAVGHAKPDIPSKFKPTWPRPALMTGVMSRVPDDELLTTLVRVPFMSHEILKLVCRRFFELVTSESFAIEQKAASCQENILVLMGTREDEINRVRSGVCLALAGDVWIPRRLPYRPRAQSRRHRSVGYAKTGVPPRQRGPVARAGRFLFIPMRRAWVVGLKLAPSPARAYRRSQG